MFLYFLIAAVHLYAEWFYGEFPLLQSLSKIALVPMLILAVVLAFAKTKDKVLIWVLFALVLSLLGDIFLLDKESINNFMFGLASFLIAHILYGISFIKSKKQNFEVQLIYKAPIYLMALVVLTVLIFVKLRKGMGEMELPVIFYMGSILFMAAMALNRFGKVRVSSFWMVMGGAILFMLSDTLIAFNKFNAWFDHSGFYIMLTYVLAQFFIVMGSIREVEVG